MVYLLVTAMVFPGMGLCVERCGNQGIEVTVSCDAGPLSPGAITYNPSDSFFNPCMNCEKEAQGPCDDIRFSAIASDNRSVTPGLDSAQLPTSFLAPSLAKQICASHSFRFGHLSSEHPRESLRSTVLLM